MLNLRQWMFVVSALAAVPVLCAPAVVRLFVGRRRRSFLVRGPPPFVVRSCAVVRSSSMRRRRSFVFLFIFRVVVPVPVLVVAPSRCPWYGDVIDASASGELLPASRRCLPSAAPDGRAGEPAPPTPSVFIYHATGASACCRGYDDDCGGGGISEAYGGDTDVPGLYAAESPGTPGMLEEGW